MSSSTLYYAVRKGMNPGIYKSWEECREQIDHYKGAEFKKVKSYAEADAYMNAPNAVASANVDELSELVEGMDIDADSKTTDIVLHRSEEKQSTPALSPEQQYAFSKYANGENVFITGPGGTGKSYLIKLIVEDLKRKGENYAVCAMTGCAAVLLGCGAKTIHSWAGIGIAKGTQEEIVRKAVDNKFTLSRWRSIKTLIIDEVSMMSVKVFEILGMIGKLTRRMHFLPFGGLQVIFLGDFYQLPPVGKPDEPETTKFCFESPLWDQTFHPKNRVLLQTYFRQKDPTYIGILNEVRAGKLSAASVAMLNSRVNAVHVDPTILPTKLFPRNADVQRVNTHMYDKIKEPEHKYLMHRRTDLKTLVDSGGKQISPIDLYKCEQLDETEIETQFKIMFENNSLEETLCLKKGALVMCLANLDVENGICNGSQGVIEDFLSNGNPLVRFLNGTTIPIMPKIYQHPDYPKFGIEQYPLRLAWAFTIHKSQGITLDIAEMDIGSRIFEFGQTYVALSRVKSLEGLYLSDFNPKKVRTNPTVIEFYEQIKQNNLTITEEEMDTDTDPNIKRVNFNRSTKTVLG